MVLRPLHLSIRAIFPAAKSQANLVCKLHVSTAVRRVIYANDAKGAFICADPDCNTKRQVNVGTCVSDFSSVYAMWGKFWRCDIIIIV